ncbi:MAG: hypothetical protein ABWX90_02970 [Candidatus Saccharimonadales bacterium]
MSFRDNAVSSKADIEEGLSEISQESAEAEAAFAADKAAEDAEDAELMAKAIDDIVKGIDPATGAVMQLDEWEIHLKSIKPSPEQWLPYIRALKDAKSEEHGYAWSTYDSSPLDFDRDHDGSMNDQLIRAATAD